MGKHPELLVSVRDVAEARAALAGGAEVIDVKDPARGPLGRADDAILSAVRDALSPKQQLSAALGELCEFSGAVPGGFDFVKCGPARLGGFDEWRDRWLRLRAAADPAQAVIVAYADWRCAGAVPFDEIIDFACAQPAPIVLIDTGCKEKSAYRRRAGLFDWQPADWLAAVVDRVHSAGGRIALAGSLRAEDFALACELQPDWIAVRGAACFDEDRDLVIDTRRVAALKAMLCAS